MFIDNELQKKSQQQNHKHHKQYVRLPHWVWLLTTKLFTLLVLGGIVILIVVLFWLVMLTNSQLRSNKKLDNIDTSIKYIEEHFEFVIDKAK